MRAFLKRQGFFVMAALCVCVIAGTALWTRRDVDQAASAPVISAAEPFTLTQPVDGEVVGAYAAAEWSETLACWSAHEGIDFQATAGEEARAAADGLVRAVERDVRWGMVIELSHRDGLTTVYRGLETARVAAGASVAAGDVIGTVGASACHHDGNCLHFEVRREGRSIDPAAHWGE